MPNVKPVIFLSGPHGGGKTTLTKHLSEKSDLFIENDFDIDFTVNFPSMAVFSAFERCLVRLYHRFYIANHARQLAERNPGKFILTNRTIYDSEAYIKTYRDMDWISGEEFQTLKTLMGEFLPRPHAIVLNPPLKVIKARLQKRKDSATRTLRDKLFINEDTNEFIKRLHGHFVRYKEDKKIFYLEADGENEARQIIAWAGKIRN